MRGDYIPLHLTVEEQAEAEDKAFQRKKHIVAARYAVIQAEHDLLKARQTLVDLEKEK